MRRSRPMVSRTSQWSWCASSVASIASTAAASPSVLISQVPMSSSLVRIDRIASSSSRASASGYQAAPAASMPAMSVGCGAGRRLDGAGRGALGAVDLDRRRSGSAARRPRSCAAAASASTPLRVGRPVALRGELQRALLHLRARRPPAWRCRRPGASPWPSGRARLRWWCRRCRPGRGAHGACRSRGSGRRCRAARRAAAPRAG